MAKKEEVNDVKSFIVFMFNDVSYHEPLILSLIRWFLIYQIT